MSSAERYFFIDGVTLLALCANSSTMLPQARSAHYTGTAYVLSARFRTAQLLMTDIGGAAPHGRTTATAQNFIAVVGRASALVVVLEVFQQGIALVVQALERA